MANVSRKAIRMTVTKDKTTGLLTVDTPLYTISNFTQNNLDYITTPFAGLSVGFDIECDDADLLEDITLRLDRQSTWGFFTHSEPVGVRNYINNALTSKMQVYTVNSLKGIAHGRPLLYLGAGPSLERDIERVREVIEKKQAIVIAGGSAIRILANKGLKPDYCLALDPYDPEWEVVFKHVDPKWTAGIKLLTNLVLEPRCFDMWQGEIYIGGGCNCFSPRDAIDGLQSIKEGQAGVSTSILYWASYMGFKELTMLGTDLCYGTDGDKLVQYADGRTEDTDEQGPVKCPKSGRITRTLWIREALFIRDAIEDNKELKVYNASGGLHIEGATETTLDRYSTPIEPTIYILPEQISVYQNDIQNRLSDFAKQLVKVLQLGVRNPKAQRLPAYQSYLKTYDYLQQFREIWTHEYNKDLIENLAYNCIEWIGKAITLRNRGIDRDDVRTDSK